MPRQFSGAASFEFRRDGDGWHVTRRFFDDIGPSGQFSLRQGLAGTRNTPLPDRHQRPLPASNPRPT
jgi:hypothetical protein